MTPPVRLAPGESRDPVDPSKIASSAYRGNVWEYVRIGHPWVAAVEGASLVVMVVLVVAGQPWPAIVAAALAIGVATWAFSDLKFQAEMGTLLAFMFMVNMVMAMTALPAFAVFLEKLFPRRSAVYAPGLLQH